MVSAAVFNRKIQDGSKNRNPKEQHLRQEPGPAWLLRLIAVFLALSLATFRTRINVVSKNAKKTLKNEQILRLPWELPHIQGRGKALLLSHKPDERIGQIRQPNKVFSLTNQPTY